MERESIMSIIKATEQFNDIDRPASLSKTKRKTADDLLLDIVNCGFSCQDSGNPCHSIWESQGCTMIEDFHLPEPWNGDIEKAQLMFFGINPRLNAGELFPRTGCDWWMRGALLNRERVADFFKNRFTSEHQYVRGLPHGPVRVKLETGSYRNARGVYWKYLHMIARLILGNDEDAGRSIIPGDKYVLSEVVHCKTLKEECWCVDENCQGHNIYY